MTLAGFGVTLRPAGTPLTARLTGPLKPLTRVMPTVAVALPPCSTLTTEGVTAMEYSGAVTDLLPRDADGHLALYWQNHAAVWERTPMAQHYVVSLTVALAVTAGRILTSALAAYAFARLKFRGRDALFLLYLATLMIPGEVTMIPNFILMSKFGWMNTYAALILPGIFTAFGTFMLRQFFLTIPSDLEEAAMIDGCSRLGILLKVIMPLSTPALATLGFLSFIGSWNDFLWPLIVTNTKDMFTLPVGLAQLQGDYARETTLTMAGAVQVLVPVFILFVIGQKRIVEGIATTGLGGT